MADFSIEHPAQDIHELLQFLRADEPEKYLFRGQTRHYPTLVPSMFRSLIVPGTENLPVLGIDGEEYAERLEERDKIRLRLLGGLIGRFGKSVGNIIAQQYGISSEAIDVTSEPDVAAFFATRRYPEYQHFNGYGDGSFGVIYRFPRHMPPTNVVGMDFMTNLIGHRDPAYRWLWFFQYAKWHEIEETGSRDAIEKMLREFGSERMRLMTMALFVDNAMMARALQEALSDSHFVTLRRYGLTRLARQHGGFIRPPFHWNCTVPRRREIVFEERVSKYFYTPSLAVAEQLVGVENSLLIPGTRIFAFWHSTVRITTYRPQDLWPSIDLDDLFSRLFTECYFVGGEWFDRHDVSADDPEFGVIDRGFFSDAQRRSREGAELYHRGDLAAARAKFEHALSLDADDEVALGFIGTICFDEDRHEEAVAAFQRVVALAPDSYSGHNGCGLSQSALGGHADAILSFSRALQLRPDYAEAYYNRAVAYGESGEFEKALDDLFEAEQLKRELLPGILALRAVYSAALGDDDSADAALRELAAAGERIDSVEEEIRTIRERRQNG